MRPLIIAALCMLSAAAIAQTRPAPGPLSPGPLSPGPLTIASQGSFFIGGRDVKSDTLSTLPAYAASGTITVDQMYVRYQTPAGALKTPITLIHG